MIRVGITFNPNKPLFYSGYNQLALTLVELLQPNYTVSLVDYTNDEKDWFDDYPKPNVPITKLYQTTELDLLIDIDGITSESARHAAKKTVVFLRTFLQFAEMDSQLYIESPYVPRSMKNVTEIWCWDIMNPPETLPAIQTLFPCPIRRVPFIWSLTVAEFYKKDKIADSDTQVASVVLPLIEGRCVHVAEKNIDNSSSSIIPLTAIKAVNKPYKFKIHNMNHIKDNKFLKENVLDNIMFDTLPVTFEDKEPFYEWTVNDILLSHSRFTPVRLGLLNAIWLGIPLIHNSPILRDLCPSLESTYYEGNSIKGIVDKLDNPTTNVQECRVALQTFAIANKQQEWQQILVSIGQIEVITEYTGPLIIAFDDMWPGFNYNSNFIMDSLRQEQPSRSIKGMLYNSAVKPNLLIFGPYSQNWRKVDAPKVFFSGENWSHPRADPNIALYISSETIEDATHMRVPTWMHFIDWYSNKSMLSTNVDDNPIRIPLHYAVTPHPIPFDQRAKFCGFVVSNPICSFRNEAFDELTKYKQVSSGGGYKNNIGGQLSLKYPGGGCGDISKHHFFAEHQFTISFENSQAPGYVTEKLLHAKMAGAVPLYWGDPTLVGTASDFVPNSFINLSNMSDATKIVDIVKKLEQNPAMCQKIASTPLLDEQRKQRALNTIATMSRRILEIASQGYTHVEQNLIDKTYMINLDTRPDRIQSFQTAHPDIKYTRISAVNGTTLPLTKSLYDLCQHNTFQWKKSVIACALSHISIWTKIVQDNSTYTLILEDDVRFTDDWNKHIKDIPDDAELLYLGGVLPANRPVLDKALEKVNEHWSKLIPNTFFTKEPIATFHFCAYSYILTKSGAQKLLDYLALSHDKLCIPLDHLVGHPVIGLTKYINNTRLTSCFQEEDPQYMNAQFNELQTEKKFDSDIYNNTECFDVTAFNTTNTTNTIKDPLKLYYLGKTPELYEQTWLEDMFEQPIEFHLFNASVNDMWCLVQRPYVDEWNKLLATTNTPFNILHLSDEFGTDNIDFYELPQCKKVVRNYLRPLNNPKVHIIPLGYHHKTVVIKPSDQRKLAWSFHGTNWFDREEQLKQFLQYTPHHCKLQPQWNDPGQTKKATYLMDLANSKFCPILRGNNMETFRFYEALEAGTLPVTVEANEWTTWIDQHLQLSQLYNWMDPHIMNDAKDIQDEVLRRWTNWKCRIKIEIKS